MKPLLLILVTAAAAYCQSFSFGVKGGVPLTDAVTKVQNQSFTFNTTTDKYIVGPTAEVHLPFGLGIEVDALYRHLSYTGTGVAGLITASNVNSGQWEFPVLGKYRFPGKVARPYIDAGVAFDKLSGLTQSVKQSVSSQTVTVVKKDTATGFVIGAGIDLHVVIHILPEIRFTRWGSTQIFDPTGLLHSNQNQAEVLVGIQF